MGRGCSVRGGGGEGLGSGSWGEVGRSDKQPAFGLSFEPPPPRLVGRDVQSSLPVSSPCAWAGVSARRPVLTHTRFPPRRQYAPRCSVCAEPIMPEPGREETVRVVALDKNFHMKCYKCEVGCTPAPSPSGMGGWWDAAHGSGGGRCWLAGPGCCNFEGGQWRRPHPPREDASLASGWRCGVLSEVTE